MTPAVVKIEFLNSLENILDRHVAGDWYLWVAAGLASLGHHSGVMEGADLLVGQAGGHMAEHLGDSVGAGVGRGSAGEAMLHSPVCRSP